VVALAEPLSVTVAPFPLAAGAMVPEAVNVDGVAVAVKLGTFTLPPLTVTDWLVGLKV
jgi:hypothetical protein